MQWQKSALQHMIQRAQAKQQGAPAPPRKSALAEEYTRPGSISKQHSSMFTPLLSTMFKGADSWFLSKYGVRGAGGLLTTVIRAMKAWAKARKPKGFPEVRDVTPIRIPDLASLASMSREEAGLEAGPTYFSLQCVGGPALKPSAKPWRPPQKAHPPGVVWEVFVWCVFEQRLQQCRDEGRSAGVYSMQLGPLTLFMDVLLATTQLLLPTDRGQAPPEPIAVYYHYTAAQCQLFRRTWGPAEPRCTPYIILPSDPRYNCRMHANFNDWEALADDAGLLHHGLQCLLQGNGKVGVQGSLVDVWQLAVDNTSLGRAVKAGQPQGLDDIFTLLEDDIFEETSGSLTVAHSVPGICVVSLHTDVTHAQVACQIFGWLRCLYCCTTFGLGIG